MKPSEKPYTLIELFAHDLKGALGNISSFADFLEHTGPLNDVQRKWLDKILSNVDRSVNLIKNMLDMQHLDTIPMTTEWVALQVLLDDALASVEGMALAKAVQIDVEIVHDATEVLCDPTWFRHVLYNLLANAVKYNKPNGTVHVKASVQGVSYILSIQDTGMGIPSESLSRIFDKFYRARTPEAKEGSGLGLAIVKGVVEAHGGTVGVTSTVGVGTTFTLSLPMPLQHPTSPHSGGEDLDGIDDSSQEAEDIHDSEAPI
jgi:signal transduction histidine kinase